MARNSSYTYDPTTGEWTKNTSNSASISSPSSTSNSASSTTSDKVAGGNNLTSSSSDKDSSTGSVEKQYNDLEINTLSGTLTFIVTEKTIELSAGDTVKLKGLGNHLSGNYYVKDVTRQISNDGYSHSATLIKTDFGNAIKVSTVVSSKDEEDSTEGSSQSSKEEQESVSSSSNANVAQRTHTVKKGETLWSISKKYYGDGSLYTKILDSSSKQMVTPDVIAVGQVLIIP